MLKELGLVVTGVTIGVVGTLYVTKDFLLEGFAHKLSEVIDEEVQDAKDEMHNEQDERDHKRDYTKPLRKSGNILGVNIRAITQKRRKLRHSHYLC